MGPPAAHWIAINFIAQNPRLVLHAWCQAPWLANQPLGEECRVTNCKTLQTSGRRAIHSNDEAGVLRGIALWVRLLQDR